ncbi:MULTISPECIES: DUF6708 domain-containing protein [unclassified Pseudomonas]|uniref:DUF6708 domain-containing protein n=1 Tax=unclassified Pseudomonas TaxID=196821 RepID=UPI002AC8C2F3|nr:MULTISPECIES: DUF6708 domain-containing protein [unclassified Pseudomonas]MEB0046413.1 hypothetical protein [Pseudomonas sp. Dout3]MEB0099323.1 hypothetical protein [Pseudomonas sp. DC1.2]WPX59469.1 hypothetical protein RHM68_02110 [Pseudomonas sp. DC1.2]
MDISTQETPRYSATPTVILAADKSTGEQLMELFITEEHTEHYLALQAGGDSDRGILTGVLGGIGGCALVGLGLLGAMQGKLDITYMTFVTGLFLFLVPFFWEVLRPLPLPILFNRRTREVYFYHEGNLYHAPWDGICAVANEFQLVGAQIGGMQSASLEIRMWKFEESETALMVSLGSPFGKSLEMQKGFWEYIRSYMNNGPYFDEYGNHSESDVFVQGQLSVRPRMSDSFKQTLERIKQAKRENGGKNYLRSIDVLGLVLDLCFYPTCRIQELTYSLAKRRSRNLWPKVVTERLKPDGPNTRLVDLEDRQDRVASNEG